MHTHRFRITGGKPLNGTVKVSGSKNAALPIIGASLMTGAPVTLENVPDIADIHVLLKILNFLKVKTEFIGNTLHIDSSGMENAAIAHELVSKLRGSSTLMGPLLSRFGEVNLAYPGGCVLGKRPMDAHLMALEALGAKVKLSGEMIHLKTEGLKGVDFTMTEASVTATENAIMAACLAVGKTVIRLAAAEPHVQDLCYFLVAMGAKIEGIGTHTLHIEGVESLDGAQYSITPDYLETGTLVLAAAITQGEVEVQNIVPHHLDIFWQKLREVGVRFELRKNSVKVLPSPKLKAIKLQTAVFPSFPTDLQAPFATLLTQAKGESFIFETLFDGRLQYLYELEKMGLKPRLLNAYQAEFEGPVQLQGASINSCDIRAGAGMVLAALAAQGETEIHDVYYIDRGYEKLEQKLRNLGAKIERLE